MIQAISDRSCSRRWRWPNGTISPAGRRSRRRAGMLRGRGLASFLEWTGGNVFEERVTVAVSGDGEIEVYASTMGMGQGIATSYAQLVVDVFGVEIERIRIVRATPIAGRGSAVPALGRCSPQGRRSITRRKWRWRMGAIWRPRRWRRPPRISNTPRGCSGSPAPIACIGLFELAGRQPDRRIYRRRDQHGERAKLAERGAYLWRSRSIRTPARWRSCPMSRSTMSGAWSIR